MATPSGIPVLGDLQPGSHIGQFYWDQHDLVETLVPFFASGLRQHERCIWICSPPLCAAEARSALAQVVPDLADCERVGQIAIVDHDEWYLRRGHLSPEQVIQGFVLVMGTATLLMYVVLDVTVMLLDPRVRRP